jgi:hypothetical protein
MCTLAIGPDWFHFDSPFAEWYPTGGQRSASCQVCSNGKNASKDLREACRLQVVILGDAWYGRAVTSQVLPL